MADQAPIRILTAGLEPRSLEIVQQICGPGSEVLVIPTADEFMGQYEQWDDNSFDGIFCGPALEGMSGNELAQVLLNQAPNTYKFYVTIKTENYEPRILLKNGFTGAFVMPIDLPLLTQSVKENILSAARSERSFRSVRIHDLTAGDALDFETFLFLPRNNKHIRYTAANQSVDSGKIEKLQSAQMTQLFVDHRDMNKFYQYSAKKLRALGEGDMSSTERQEKLKDSVRVLFNDIFDQSVKADFDQGREVIKQCESIISNYITKGASSNWYKKLSNAMGEGGDTYNHASNVSTFAALFAIGLQHPNPEDLAMAGLFHDLGLAQLPEELQAKIPSDLTTDAERQVYFTHAEKSLTMIKNKRIIIPESVEKAILQHHEEWNGRGWPKQLPYNRITKEAQILSFADQFDYLTRVEAGNVRLKPLEAFEKIRANGSINPDILNGIKKLLSGESEPTAAKPA